MQISFEYTPAELSKALRAINRHAGTGLSVLRIALLAVLAGTVLVPMRHIGRLPLWLILQQAVQNPLFWICLVLSVVTAPWFLARTSWKRNANAMLGFTHNYLIQPEGISYTGGGQQVNYTWYTFARVKRTRHFLLLAQPGHTMVALPLRCFASEAEAQNVQHMVNEGVSAAAQRQAPVLAYVPEPNEYAFSYLYDAALAGAASMYMANKVKQKNQARNYTLIVLFFVPVVVCAVLAGLGYLSFGWVFAAFIAWLFVIALCRQQNVNIQKSNPNSSVFAPPWRQGICTLEVRSEGLRLCHQNYEYVYNWPAITAVESAEGMAAIYSDSFILTAFPLTAMPWPQMDAALNYIYSHAHRAKGPQ